MCEHAHTHLSCWLLSLWPCSSFGFLSFQLHKPACFCLSLGPRSPTLVSFCTPFPESVRSRASWRSGLNCTKSGRDQCPATWRGCSCWGSGGWGSDLSPAVAPGKYRWPLQGLVSLVSFYTLLARGWRSWPIPHAEGGLLPLKRERVQGSRSFCLCLTSLKLSTDTGPSSCTILTRKVHALECIPWREHAERPRCFWTRVYLGGGDVQPASSPRPFPLPGHRSDLLGACRLLLLFSQTGIPCAPDQCSPCLSLILCVRWRVPRFSKISKIDGKGFHWLIKEIKIVLKESVSSKRLLQTSLRKTNQCLCLGTSQQSLPNLVETKVHTIVP